MICLGITILWAAWVIWVCREFAENIGNRGGLPAHTREGEERRPIPTRTMQDRSARSEGVHVHAWRWALF